jgi:hypothetical protein
MKIYPINHPEQFPYYVGINAIGVYTPGLSGHHTWDSMTITWSRATLTWDQYN